MGQVGQAAPSISGSGSGGSCCPCSLPRAVRRLALAVLLVLGLVSLAYTSAGRTLRARSWRQVPPSPREREIVVAQADAGPLPRRAAERLAATRPGGSRFLWVRPALLRLGEYGVVAVAVAAAAAAATATATATVTAAGFALLLVVASHHYDGLYRVLNRLAPPSPLVGAAGLGTVGRPLLVVALAVVGGSVAVGGLWATAAVLGILYLVVEPAERAARGPRSRPGDPTRRSAGNG